MTSNGMQQTWEVQIDPSSVSRVGLIPVNARETVGGLAREVYACLEDFPGIPLTTGEIMDGVGHDSRSEILRSLDHLVAWGIVERYDCIEPQFGQAWMLRGICFFRAEYRVGRIYRPAVKS